ncbi:MAG: hypothetical protein ACRET6_08150 [Burkholderiales bacterium]
MIRSRICPAESFVFKYRRANCTCVQVAHGLDCGADPVMILFRAMQFAGDAVDHAVLYNFRASKANKPRWIIVMRHRNLTKCEVYTKHFPECEIVDSGDGGGQKIPPKAQTPPRAFK